LGLVNIDKVGSSDLQLLGLVCGKKIIIKIMLAISLAFVFSVGIVYILRKITNEEPWL
jgi:hypothetical protein